MNPPDIMMMQDRPFHHHPHAVPILPLLRHEHSPLFPFPFRRALPSAPLSPHPLNPHTLPTIRLPSTLSDDLTRRPSIARRDIQRRIAGEEVAGAEQDRHCRFRREGQ